MQEKEEKIECTFLNKSMGKGYYICNLEQLPITQKMCEKCKERKK